MSSQHPLSNPTSSQLDELSMRWNVEEEPEQNTQNFRPSTQQILLDLPHRSRLKEWGHTLRVLFRRRETELEVMPFWKDLPIAFAVISSAILILLVMVYGLLNFNNIQPRIQFYYDAIQGKWEQADKIVILFLPIMLLVLESLILRFIYEIFRYDRRLSQIIAWVLVVFNLLTIVAIGQIYSLI